MRPQSDQPDQQRERPVTPRHTPLHSRSQLAAPPPESVLDASQERLATARPGAAGEPAGPPDPGRHDPRRPDPGGPDPGPRDPGPPAPGALNPGPLDPAGPLDPGTGPLREHLEAVRLHAQHASSWLETSSHFARLVNRDGVVPVTVRFSPHDLAFLAEAREEMLGFAELGLRLIELHQPLDAGEAASDPAASALRCRSCMWRWPCPTFRTLAEVLHGIRPG
jgi:hypothetical protein